MSTNGNQKKPQKKVMRGSEYREAEAKKPVIRHKRGPVGVRAAKSVVFRFSSELL